MSLSTFKELVDRVLQEAGMGAQRRDLAKEWVNAAHEDICEAHDWRELIKTGTITTVAPYTTGTVATSGTTVTGTGTTFTSAMAGRKFAAGYGKPWFLIASYSSGTSIDLDTSWPWTDLSGDTYTIYEDVYSLASDVDKVLKDRVYLYDDEGRRLARLNPGHFLSLRDFPESAGRPDYYTLIENDSNGLLQMQLGGRAPDEVYVVKYSYKAKHTEMVSDGEEPQLRSTLGETIVEGALMRAYKMPEFAGTGMRESQEAAFERSLSKKINRARREGGRGVQPQTPTGRSMGAAQGWPFSLPVDSD